MKRTILITAAVLGLAPAGRAATTLSWNPTTPDWNLVTANWFDANLGQNVPFTQGADVVFNDNGSGQPTVNLVGDLSPTFVLVEGSINYVLSGATGGKLLNVQALTKRGGGNLTLDADNAITGYTVIEEGTLEIGAGSSRGALGSGPVTNNSTLAINRTGTLNVTNYLDGSGGLSITGGTINMRGTNTLTGSLVHNGGILNFLGGASIGNPSSILIAAASNTRLQISDSIDLPAGCAITFTGASGGLRGAMQSMAGNNSVSGPILVGEGSGGLVQLMAMTAGGEFTVNSSVSDLGGTPYSGPFYLRGTAGIGRLYGVINLPDATLVKTDNNSLWTIHSTGNMAANTLVAQGVLRLGADDALPVAPFVIGQASATAVLDLAGFDQQVTTLNDVAGDTAIIANSSDSSDSVLTLSGGGVYGGSIQDSISNGTRRVALTLLSGAQQLTSLCSYSGPTKILGGGIALVGAGEIPNSAVIEMADGAAIDVRLRSDATLTVQPGQTLKGNAAFNVVGSLTNQGTIELKVAKTGGAVQNDSIRSIDQMTCGGTLSLILSGEPLGAGDSFKLFHAAAYHGSFGTLLPETPGPGLAWNTDSLLVDGTLSVVAGSVPSTPTNITATVSGTDLVVSWPENYVGWTLQSQTNALTTGLANNWFDLPASVFTNRMFLPIDPVNGSVFYRLRYNPNP